LDNVQVVKDLLARLDARMETSRSQEHGSLLGGDLEKAKEAAFRLDEAATIRQWVEHSLGRLIEAES